MHKHLVIFAAWALVVLSDSVEDVYTKCGENTKCAEQKFIKLVDEYDDNPTVSFFDEKLVIQRTHEQPVIPRSEETLLDRILRYIASHELNVKFPASDVIGRSFPSEARSRKLKKLILPLLLLLKLKAAILIPIALSVIALIAFKGLGAGLVALALSGATALKSLLEGHGTTSKLTYEVIPQIASPHWSRAGVAGYESWPVPGYHTIAK